MLSKEEEEAIKRLEKRIKDNENYTLTQVWLTDDVVATNIVLKLITKLQKENEEKDRQIDLMAEYWHCGLAICENCANYDEYKCKICIKQYFERKVKDVKKTKTEKMQEL